MVDHEIFVKIQSDSDCKIILKAIKWMQKIRKKQATWSWDFVRRWRKVLYDHHQAPKKTFRVLLCWARKDGWHLDGAKSSNAGCSISTRNNRSFDSSVDEWWENRTTWCNRDWRSSSIAWTLQRRRREQQQVIVWLSKCWKPLNKQNRRCTESWRCTGGRNASFQF